MDTKEIIKDLPDIDLVKGLSNLLEMAGSIIPNNIYEMTFELINRYCQIKWNTERDPSDYSATGGKLY